MQLSKRVYSVKCRDGKILVFDGNEKLSDVVSILGENIPHKFQSFLSGTEFQPSPEVSLSTVGYLSAFIGLIVAALLFFNQANSSGKGNDFDSTKKNGYENTKF